MPDFHVQKITPSASQAIQEAILLGGAREIGDVLSQVKDDCDFPENVRYSLEALFYFRHYYGKGGELEPSKKEDKKRVLEMEALWGQEIIKSLEYYSVSNARKVAQE